MHTAIVTLAIGERYQRAWKMLCETRWRQYCAAHGYDLVVIEEPLDRSPRAAARSPSWQKCLILAPEVAGSYERVVWVDSDIVINPAAPAIADGVPLEKVGAVDEHHYPSAELRRRIVSDLAVAWRGVNDNLARNWESFLDPADWHAFAGLPRRGKHMVQAGVLVLSPKHHRELLELVYHGYEDKGGDALNYEMRPLSFEIQERGLEHWLDPRFNALIFMWALYHERILRKPVKSPMDKIALIKAQYERSYFLHFAARQDLMEFVRAAGIA